MCKRLIILIHGFNVSDGGQRTVGKLQPFFQAEDNTVCSVMNYGYFGLISTHLLNDNVARRLAKKIINARFHFNEVVVVGHSNGCAIAHLASDLLVGVPKPASIRYVYINPALERTLAPSTAVGQFIILHNPKDVAVKLSKLLPWGRKNRPWGRMGADGYVGNDSRAININTLERYEVDAKGHSGVFEDEVVSYYGEELRKLIFI